MSTFTCPHCDEPAAQRPVPRRDSAFSAVAGSRWSRPARTLSVLWEDGRQSDFDVRDLRLACPCALCVEEMGGRPLLDPRSVRPDVAPRTITSRGNYAITISWDDGHSTGIYSFEHLRALGERGAAEVVEDV